MFGMMHGDRVEVSGDLSYDYIQVRDSSVRGEKPDINALATIDQDRAAVMVWNYHDLNAIGPRVQVNLVLKGLEQNAVEMTHYRIDQEHSNSFEVWKSMDSPQNPSEEQYRILEEAGQLQMMSNPETVKVKDNTLDLSVELPGQAVSLLVLNW